MRRLLALLVLVALPAGAEIRRDPPGVNVNASSATTVLITFGGLDDQEPVEALWCLQLVPAAPDLGQRALADGQRALTDLVGDGIPDLVGLDNSSLVVAPGRGDGTFGPVTTAVSINGTADYGEDAALAVLLDTLAAMQTALKEELA